MAQFFGSKAELKFDFSKLKEEMKNYRRRGFGSYVIDKGIEVTTIGDASPKYIPRQLRSPTEEEDMSKQRSYIFGLSVTSVVKWMGKHNWSLEKAVQVVHKLASGPIEESSIRTALSDGQSPRWSKGMADLSVTEIEMLEKAYDPNFVMPKSEIKIEKEPRKDGDENIDENYLQNQINDLEKDLRIAEEHVQSLNDRIDDILKQKPKRVEIVIQHKDTTIKLDEHIHPVFEQVMFHINCGDNVMLVGPKGSGKTTLAEQVAKALNRPHAAISLSAGVTESKLLGRLTPNITNGKSEYHSTPFVDLCETGGVFLLDEVDGGDPNVLLTMNMALANRRLVLDRPKKPIIDLHDDFLCIAAANTYGNGADRQYVGRNQMDGAFADRFTFIPMDYDQDLERKLCPEHPELVDVMHTFRQRIASNRLERAISTRFMVKAYGWMIHGKDMQYVKKMLFAGWRDDERRKVEVS